MDFGELGNGIEPKTILKLTLNFNSFIFLPSCGFIHEFQWTKCSGDFSPTTCKITYPRSVGSKGRFHGVRYFSTLTYNKTITIIQYYKLTNAIK